MTPPTSSAAASAEPEYELVTAVRARGRIVRVFDVARLLGLGGRPVRQVALQIVPNGEETASIQGAHRTVAEIAKGAGPGEEGAKRDPDIFANEKNLEALFRICRRVDAKGQPTRTAAFPGVAWMRENLSTDELGSLLNLYDELKRRHAGTPLEVDAETVDAVVEALVQHLGDDMPEVILAPYPRWWLTHFCVLVAEQLVQARKSTEILLTEREAWQKEREAMEEERAALEEERGALEAELAALRAGTSAAATEPPPAE